MDSAALERLAKKAGPIMTVLIHRVIRLATCAWCGGSGDYRGTGYCAGCGGTGQAR